MPLDDLFGNRIQAACIYCELSYPAGSDDLRLCFKKGIVRTDYYCSKFKYDPLMRIPRRPLELEQYDEKDFKL